jgi:hypothetical protein
MFNFIDNYSFIPVSGCVDMDPSELLCPGHNMLLRRPSLRRPGWCDFEESTPLS